MPRIPIYPTHPDRHAILLVAGYRFWINILADIIDKATRSRFMAGIRSQNTKPERRLRSALHRAGLRYVLNDRRLVGSPDIVFPKYRAVLFVHGCFWHRHSLCSKATTPTTNVAFWLEKFRRNEDRDAVVREQLLRQGWRVGVVWECAVKGSGNSEVVGAIEDWLSGSDSLFEFP